MLGLGRALRLPVMAEGVETTAELAFLEDELCSEAQGYLLGRPQPYEKIFSSDGAQVQPQPAASRKVA